MNCKIHTESDKHTCNDGCIYTHAMMIVYSPLWYNFWGCGKIMIGKVSLGNCVTLLGSTLYKQQHLQGTTAVSFEWNGAKSLHCNNMYSFVARPTQFCVTVHVPISASDKKLCRHLGR